MLLHNPLDGAQRPHNRKLEQHVILFTRIIIDEADRFEREMRVGNELLCDHLGGVASPDDERGTTWIVAAPTSVISADGSY